MKYIYDKSGEYGNGFTNTTENGKKYVTINLASKGLTAQTAAHETVHTIGKQFVKAMYNDIVTTDSDGKRTFNVKDDKLKATLEKAVAQYNEAYGAYDEETKSEMVNEEIVAMFIETTLSEPKRLLDEIDGNTSLIGRIKDILKSFVSQQGQLTQSDKTLVNKAYNAFKSAIETKKTDKCNYTMSANAKGALQYDLNDGIDNDENWYYNDVMQKEDKDNGRTRRYTLLHSEYENKAKHLRERSGARQIGNNITRRSSLNFGATRKAVKGKEFKVINWQKDEFRRNNERSNPIIYERVDRNEYARNKHQGNNTASLGRLSKNGQINSVHQEESESDGKRHNQRSSSNKQKLNGTILSYHADRAKKRIQEMKKKRHPIRETSNPSAMTSKRS